MVFKYLWLLPAGRALLNLGDKNKSKQLGSAMKQARWGRQNRTTPLEKLAAAVSTFMLCQSAALGGQNILAGGIPCGYEITHVIDAPPCQFSALIGATGISPNGQYFCGAYTSTCTGLNYLPYVYDIAKNEFIIIPFGPGFDEATCQAVNDAGVVCGTGHKMSVGQRGFVYELNTGVWTEILPPNADGWSSTSAINSLNLVCGYRTIDDGGSPVVPKTAYLWSPALGFADVGLVNGESTGFADVNDAGTATGTMLSNGITVTFLWIEGSVIELDTLAGLQTFPTAMNNKNEVVGRAHVPNFNGSGVVNHAFLATTDGIIDLGVLPGFERSIAHDINDSSTVTGYVRAPGSLDHGFIWHDGIMKDVNDLVVDSSGIIVEYGAGISLAGRIVAGAEALDGNDIVVVLEPIRSSPADIFSNCKVDVDDLLMVIHHWGETQSQADIDDNGLVGLSDLEIVLKEWTFEPGDDS